MDRDERDERDEKRKARRKAQRFCGYCGTRLSGSNTSVTCHATCAGHFPRVAAYRAELESKGY